MELIIAIMFFLTLVGMLYILFSCFDDPAGRELDRMNNAIEVALVKKINEVAEIMKMRGL